MLLQCLGKTRTETCLHKKSSLANLFAEPLGTSLEYTILKDFGLYLVCWWETKKKKKVVKTVARERISYSEVSRVFNITENSHRLQNTVSSRFVLNNKKRPTI